MICIGGLPVSKGIWAGPSLKYFTWFIGADGKARVSRSKELWPVSWHQILSACSIRAPRNRKRLEPKFKAAADAWSQTVQAFGDEMLAHPTQPPHSTPESCHSWYSRIPIAGLKQMLFLGGGDGTIDVQSVSIRDSLSDPSHDDLKSLVSTNQRKKRLRKKLSRGFS